MRIYHLILIALCGLDLAGCTSRYKTPDDTIVTVIGSPILNLDPLLATDANTQHINQLIHIALVRIGEHLTPGPFLAESFQIINDTTLEFTLKHSCFFQTGQEITADDVEYSLSLYSSAVHNSLFREHFKKISRFEKISSYKFRFHLERPAPGILYDLELMKIFPRNAYNAQKFQSDPVGGGFYRVLRNDTSGLLLTRSDIKCMPAPPTPFIQIKIVRDDLSRFLKLKNGEIDIIINEMDNRKFRPILDGKVPGLLAKASPGTTYVYLGVNFANLHLRKPEVRRALALGIDAPAMIKYKLAGLAEPSASVLTPNNWYFEPGLKPIERNITEAKRLLDQAGYYNGENNKPPLQLTLKTTTYKPIVENARAITEQLKEIGVIVKHKAYEWGTFYSDVKARNTELYLLRWVGISSPDLLYEIFHSSQLQQNNRTSYVNPEMDKNLDLMMNSMDLNKRRIAARNAQGIFAKDLPYISLWHAWNVAAYRKSLKNVNLLATGSWDIFLNMQKVRE